MARKLSEYERKRRFGVTPEPPATAGELPARGERPFFMIHKHHARRLHYDLRLEMEGALASWAIPKGPSLDPAAKRLAIETEDHPLAYGAFEGRIPEGEYGAGDAIIWDRGTWDTVPPGEGSAQRRAGRLTLVFDGEKLKGKFHLVRMRRSQGGKASWLLFKAHDAWEDPDFDVTAARPESVETGRMVTRGPESARLLHDPHPPARRLVEKVWPPMLATLSTPGEADEKTHWLEVKYDGYRALAALSGGEVALLSRNGLDLGARFPAVDRALQRLAVAEAVIDGEIVRLDAKGRPKFEALQRGSGTLRYFVFDLLWLDGRDLRGEPLERRREVLESLLAGSAPPVALAERIEAPVAKAMKAAKRLGLEGLIAKRRGSRYVGARSRAWLKLKVCESQEVAVVGFTPMANGRRAIGALLVAVWDAKAKRFEFAGKVGTGFNDALRRELRRALEAEVVEKPAVHGAPRLEAAKWVEPRLVAEVEFAEWTRDGKLRHPSFQGLRDDKAPKEAVRERRR